MKPKFYVVVALLMGVFTSNAQDIHFSQYYASPLTLNPALTGKFDGLYRITGIYRGQYYGMTQSASTFRTPSVSVDFSLLKEKMKGNALGVGLAVTHDGQTSTGGNINTTSVALALGYTLNLGKKKATQLSVGLTPSYTFKSNNGAYEYPDAFNQADLSYRTGTPEDEKITSPKVNYFNLSFGLFFNTNPIKWLTFYAGYAMLNVVRPNVAVITKGTPDGSIPFRHVVRGGFEFDLTKKWTLIPGFLYQNMAKANEANFGVTVGYNIIDKEVDGKRERATVFLGLWNRLGDDVNGAFAYRNITPKIGGEYKNFRIGFAYDVDVSGFASDTKAAGVSRPQAYELSLSYMGFGSKPPKENKWLFNPRY